MFDTKDFKLSEPLQNVFNIKAFLVKILAKWYWFVLCMLIAVFWVFQSNKRIENIYGMDAIIVIKEQNNPFFTNNTSLVFNWGGTSDKVQTVITTLNSRSHAEKVVSRLQYYIKYQKKGDYFFEDVYGLVPFKAVIDKSRGQLINLPIKIKVLSASRFQLSVNFEEAKQAQLFHYIDNTTSSCNINKPVFKANYLFNQMIDLPFFNGKLVLETGKNININEEFYLQFADFNSTVAAYRGINVAVDQKAPSVIKLDMQGSNKNRLVEYLNTTVNMLREDELYSKNLFAVNTINFIDSTLNVIEGQLKNTEDDLKKFKKNINIYEIEAGGEKISEELSALDLEEDGYKRKLSYYKFLKSYLEKNTDYSKLPAPSAAGIDDGNIVSGISKMIQMSVERADKAYSAKNPKLYSEIDSQMESLKKVLLNNIESAKNVIYLDMGLLRNKIQTAEGTIRKLPEQQQDYINITRKYDLKEKIYATFLEKRSEADIVKAANISDIEFIDSAKDIGGGFRGPKKSINYVLALLIAFFIPLLIIFLIVLFDNNLNSVEDIQNHTKIPIIGVIGQKNSTNNLSVFEKPKSPLAESFRTVRSSLQFMYKKQNIDGAKVLMITSSISSEGKSFCSINLATVFALSEKKTVIVGLDLRKPKIFGDFNVSNTSGVVNYLVKQKTLSEIVTKTQIPNLDLITSGPIPPNPSELLMSDAMIELIEELKKEYSYIILDTPPVGLVSDALELSHLADATIYVTRQAYTKKGMLSVVNERHKTGELKNISILFNGFQNKSKYGYGYGYGSGYGAYGYGYGAYYEEEIAPKHWFEKLKQKFNFKS